MFKWKQIWRVAVLLVLLVWFGLFFCHYINFTTADLGRHLKNGEMVLRGDFQVLKTNFYSYTEPNFPFINHHWGGGVFFFIIWNLFGFVGLSAFCLILSIIIFLIFFDIARKEAGFVISAIIAALAIPLMSSRAEVRPEIFSYFLSALFFWILWYYRAGLLSRKKLFILIPLELIWANTHIYFIFGFALIGLFLFEKLLKEFLVAQKSLSRELLLHKPGLWLLFFKKVWEKTKVLVLVFFASAAVSFITPFGWKGLTYPFRIFQNYGYRIVENQSVWFLEGLNFSNSNIFLFKVVFWALVLSFVFLLIKRRKKFSVNYFCLAVVFGTLGWLAIRNFSLFAFFALVIIAYNVKNGPGRKFKMNSINAKMAIVFVALTIFFVNFISYSERLSFAKGHFGFGLPPNINQSAEFFKEQDIQGPILNNYDIGGYLIYHLESEEKVFVDNRPEAYSVPFFEEIYIPLQQDSAIFKKQDEIYNFNAIFFSYHDFTPWGQNFLIERINDSDWAPVFADGYALIFLKRNELNQPIIEKYEIPRNGFKLKSVRH